MTKTTSISNPAFQKKASPVSSGFNLVPQVNNFNSVFDVKPLEEEEVMKLEVLLMENFQQGALSKAQVTENLKELKSITAEIKAIGKQGIVLMGERIFKVKELLKPYRDGTFSKWLEDTFGNRKSGYNLLSYYELYSSLPDNELKERLKKIPQKTAYILASRDGDVEKKAEIIRDYHNLSHNEIMLLIHEKFPLSIKDKRTRKEVNAKKIATIYKELRKIEKKKNQLSKENMNSLFNIRELVDSILSVGEAIPV